MGRCNPPTLFCFGLNWIYLTVAILAEVIATTALKSSEGFTRLWPSLIVVAGYGGAFFFLSLTLNTIPLGIAYAVWSGVGIVAISLLGWVIYKQQLDLAALLGIGLIVSGVIIIQAFSQSSGH